jgi:hypothetical protein
VFSYTKLSKIIANKSRINPGATLTCLIAAADLILTACSSQPLKTMTLEPQFTLNDYSKAKSLSDYAGKPVLFLLGNNFSMPAEDCNGGDVSASVVMACLSSYTRRLADSE